MSKSSTPRRLLDHSRWRVTAGSLFKMRASDRGPAGRVHLTHHPGVAYTGRMEESPSHDVFTCVRPTVRKEARQVSIMLNMRQWISVAIAAAVLLGTAAAQTPQPFPRGTPPAPAPAPPATSRPTQAPPAPAPTTSAPAPPAAAPVDPATPSEASLGFPIYPGAQFIASYDAGRAQRYYIFGSTTGFTELVTYYRTVLKDKGNLVLQDPTTHMFEMGKFKTDKIAIPQGVTVKDITPREW